VQSLDLAIRLARWLRKGVVLVLGLSVVAVGVVMLVTPGPAFVVIPAGLAILATEFYWARRLLQKVRHRIEDRVRQTLGRGHSPAETDHRSAAASAEHGSTPDRGREQPQGHCPGGNKDNTGPSENDSTVGQSDSTTNPRC